MMNFICGSTGSGKTQKLITVANKELDNTNGLIVYIDKSDKNRLSIDTRIRFINAGEFSIGDIDKFFGFICGLIAGNYDINRIFIDNIMEIANINDHGQLNQLFSDIAAFASDNKVGFYLTINDTDMDKSGAKEAYCML
jgi:hypothetical protein